MQQPELQGGSAKTVHIAKFFEADNPACKVSMCAFASHWIYLSFDTPLTKLMTQGKTLSASFSTRNGTFSTKTRKNLVLKYLGARAWTTISEPNVRQQSRENSYGHVFIHDRTATKVAVIEMDYA